MLEQERHGTALRNMPDLQFGLPFKTKKEQKIPSRQHLSTVQCRPSGWRVSWLWTQRLGSLLWWQVS